MMYKIPQTRLSIFSYDYAMLADSKMQQSQGHLEGLVLSTCCSHVTDKKLKACKHLKSNSHNKQKNEEWLFWSSDIKLWALRRQQWPMPPNVFFSGKILRISEG